MPVRGGSLLTGFRRRLLETLLSNIPLESTYLKDVWTQVDAFSHYGARLTQLMVSNLPFGARVKILGIFHFGELYKDAQNRLFIRVKLSKSLRLNYENVDILLY